MTMKHVRFSRDQSVLVLYFHLAAYRSKEILRWQPAALQRFDGLTELELKANIAHSKSFCSDIPLIEQIKENNQHMLNGVRCLKIK